MKLSNSTGKISGLEIGHSIWLVTSDQIIVVLERDGRFLVKDIQARPTDIDYMTAISATVN